MSQQENLQLVQQMYVAFGRGDFPALLSALSADIDWEVPGPAAIPLCGRRRGRQQVTQFFQTLGETFETQHFEPREFFAQNDCVVVLGHERHRVKSTGRIFEDDWVQVFTVRDAKIVRYREYVDTAALAAALET